MRGVKAVPRGRGSSATADFARSRQVRTLALAAVHRELGQLGVGLLAAAVDGLAQRLAHGRVVLAVVDDLARLLGGVPGGVRVFGRLGQRLELLVGLLLQGLAGRVEPRQQFGPVGAGQFARRLLVVLGEQQRLAVLPHLAEQGLGELRAELFAVGTRAGHDGVGLGQRAPVLGVLARCGVGLVHVLGERRPEVLRHLARFEAGDGEHDIVSDVGQGHVFGVVLRWGWLRARMCAGPSIARGSGLASFAPECPCWLVLTPACTGPYRRPGSTPHPAPELARMGQAAHNKIVSFIWAIADASTSCISWTRSAQALTTTAFHILPA